MINKYTQQIYKTYHIKPLAYKFIKAIDQNQGISNEKLASITKVSAIHVANVCKILEEQHLIMDVSAHKGRRAWVLPIRTLAELIEKAEKETL
jgi:DNA-binding MarR family transcriptional regulator